MVARLRDAHLEEIGKAEHRGGRGEPAAGVSPDTGPLDVDPRIPARQLLHAGDLIGNRVVAAHRAVVRVLERLRPARRAHPVDRDDDEAELRQGLTIAARRREGAAAGAAGLRTRIDVVDDRILPRRIEVRGTEQQAVDVGLAVVSRHLDRHRRLPAGCHELRDVGLLERKLDCAALRIAQHHDGRHVGFRVAVDQVPAGRRQLHRVCPIVPCERHDGAAVETGSVVVKEVRILTRLAPVRAEPDGSRRLVDARDLHDRAVAGRDRVLQPAGWQIVEIELAPIVALRVPHDLVGLPQHAPAGARLELRRHCFLEHVTDGAGRGVCHAQHHALVVA